MPNKKIAINKKSSADRKSAIRKKQTAKLGKNREKPAADASVSPEEQIKAEREKYIAMWAGVMFFMAIIVFVWLISFKNNFQAINQPAQNGGGELGDIIKNFSQAVEEVEDDLGGLRETINSEELSPDEKISQEEEIASLRQRLEEMEKRVELEKMLSKINNSLSEEDIIEQK